MIDYQHIHEFEFLSKFSEELSAGNFVYDAFESIRTHYVCGEQRKCFVYVPTDGGKAFFVQSFDTGTVVAQGVQFEIGELRVSPACYIGKIRAQAATIGASTIRAVGLPNVPTDDFSAASRCHHIFGAIAEELLYGNRQIIIKASSREEAEGYVKGISLLLPQSFMQKQGFYVGECMPDKLQLTVFDRSKKITLKTAINVVYGSEFDTQSYLKNYCVIDTTVGASTATGSYLGTLLSELNLSSPDARTYSRSIAEAFDADGNFDRAALEQLCAEAMFNMLPASDSRKGKLAMGIMHCENSFAKSAAIAYLLQSGAIRNAEFRGLMTSYVSDADVAERIFEALTEIIGNYDNGCDALLEAVIAADESGERFSRWLECATEHNVELEINTFASVKRVLKSVTTAHGYLTRDNVVERFARTAIEHYDVAQWKVGNPQQRFEALFGAITAEDYAFNKGNFFKWLVSLIMVSAYYEDALAEERNERVIGLANYLVRIGRGEVKMTPIAYLLLLTDLQHHIYVMGTEYNEGRLKELDSFMFENHQLRASMRGNVRNLGLSQLIMLNDRLLKNGSGYTKMSDLVYETLLGEKNALQYLANPESSATFTEFVQRLDDETKRKYSTVVAKIETSEQEEESNEEFENLRCNYVYDCYRTLPASKRKKILRAAGLDTTTADADLPFNNPNESLNIVEGTINEFGGGKQQGIQRKQQNPMILAVSLTWGLLSLLLLALPAAIQVLVTGRFEPSFFAAKLSIFLQPYYYWLPPFVFALNTFTYLALDDNGSRFARASAITVLVGIVPYLVYVAAYLMCYFFGISLQIM